MAGPTTDVEHGPTRNGETPFDGLLVPQPHTGSEIAIDEAVQQGIAVAIDGSEVVRIRIEKLRCAIARHLMQPPVRTYLLLPVAVPVRKLRLGKTTIDSLG